MLHYSAPAATERSGLLVGLWKLSCNNQSGIWPLPQQVLQQLFGGTGRIDAIRRSSRKDARQMLLMCCCTDNVLSRWTPWYLIEVLKGTLFPPMFAHSLSTDSRHNFSFICVQLKLVAIHPDSAEHQYMSQYRTEQKWTDQVVHVWTAQCHRRTCDSHNHGQKSQRLGVQSKQDWS